MTSAKSELITVAILGAGGRGTLFAQIIRDLNHLGKVVAVAEQRDAYRERLAREHGLPREAVFTDWKEFVKQPKMCDAVIVATMDREHVEPAVACLDKGYHLLLEKPMATTLADCAAIAAAQRRSGKVVAVCHSMRYNKAFSKVKEIVDSGRIGRIVSLDQIEQVAWWHQAHSFVRGNWGNESQSSFMLLAKSCHDIDYIAYLIGKPCVRVGSFGSLSYFTRDNAPPGSAERCTDGCPVEPTCPYSAIKQYVQAQDLTVWPPDVVSPVHTREAHLEAIRTGPYGRCVWRCDNDVVDHQVVAMEFEGGVTATFTMTAFTQSGGRKLRVHGTKGDLAFDEDTVTVRTFADNNIEKIVIGREGGGHGGGDSRIVRCWLEALKRDDPTLILTDAQESLRTHTIVFAAEKARREKRTVQVAELNT
jgi:predicted dehydrogenase